MCVIALGAALAPALGIALGTGAAATATATAVGMSAISTGMGIATAAMSHKAQSDMAKQQQVQNDINFQNAVKSQDLQYRQNNEQSMQEADAAVDARVDNVLQAARIKSRMKASAGEAGISGMGINHMLRDVDRIESGNVAMINRNLDSVKRQNFYNAAGIKAQTESRINNQPIPQRPSLLATGLQIGGAVTGGYSQYKSYTA